jgi:hypothetical protein
MIDWPSLYAFVKSRKENEDLVLADMIYLLEKGYFTLESEEGRPVLVRASSERFDHPIFDSIGGSAGPDELADYAFSLRDKFFIWIVKSSQPYIRWDIENRISKASLWLWGISVIGWIPFYFLHLRLVLICWFAIPTLALILSLAKAPATPFGRQLIFEGDSQKVTSFNLARRGISVLRKNNSDLFQFASLFKNFYRGRSLSRQGRNRPR